MVKIILKSNKGMAMVLAMVIGVVATMAGIALLHVSNTDTIQVERNEDSAQAYYFAQSGVELAIGVIINNGPEYLSEKNSDYKEPFYGSLGDITFQKEPNNPPDHTIEFKISRDSDQEGDFFKIYSKGIVRSGDSTGTEVSSDAEEYKIYVKDLFGNGGNNGGNNGDNNGVGPLDMIFALEKIDLSTGGSSEIHGDTGTNSTAPDSVIFAYSTKILDGNLFIGPGGDWAKDGIVVFNGYGRGPETNIPGGSILNLPLPRNYPLPVFPSAPDFENRGSINADWNPPPGGYKINESGSYSSINVLNRLTINIGNEDVIIRTGVLSVTGSGQIVLNKTGSGRLILYVEDSFTLENSAKINSGGNYDDIYMYYSGRKEPSIGGSTEFIGSVYILNTDLTITGSGGLKGNIVTGGSAVNITGNATANVRAIYAPNAAVKLTGSGSMRGALVARSIKMEGNSRIYYDDSINIDFLEQLNWGSGNVPENEEPNYQNWRSLISTIS